MGMALPSADEAYWNLVAAARAEDGISPEEQKVLNAYVLKLGLDPRQAKEIQVLATAENPPRLRIPKDVEGRRQTLRAVLEVVGADGRMAPRELAVVRALGERLSLVARDVDGLVQAALQGSAKLDRAFAALRLSAPESPATVEFVGPVRQGPQPGDWLRAVPVAARWAPAVRDCRRCDRAFAARDRTEPLCRPCRFNDVAEHLSWGRCGTFVGIFFCILFVPIALLVESVSGGWSWGWETAFRELAALPAIHGQGGRQLGALIVYLSPAAASTALVAWVLAWGIGALIMLHARRSESPKR